jgi:GR25 family glycosyltransferase involved in LPS biosynthesis
MHKLKIFCIAIKNHDQSIKMLTDCLASAKKHDWNVEPYWGFDKNYITDETWKTVGLTPSQDKKFQKRVGAQGCFLSHYHLWQRCLTLNEPIIILEHDAVIEQSFTNIVTDKDLIKLYTAFKKNNEDQYTGKWSSASHAYYITPVGAEKLITWSKQNFGYHVDVMFGTNIINWGYYDNDLVSMNKNAISTITIK